MNKNLYDRIAIIPNSLVKHLEDCFNSINGNQNIEGYNRNQQLRQGKQATYQQIKRIAIMNNTIRTIAHTVFTLIVKE